MTGDDGGRTAVRHLATVRDDDAAVTVRHVETPKGERLELESDRETRVRLDAVALECLAWQNRDRFEAIFDRPGNETRDAPPIVHVDFDSSAPLATITNEFAHVEVRKVTGSGRELLALNAPKVGERVVLTGPGLEVVAAQPQSAITELVRKRVE